jgi:hypothetical protein
MTAFVMPNELYLVTMGATGPGISVGAGKDVTAMDQITQLADDHHHQQLAYAEAQRPAQHVLALARASRRADRRARRLRA